MQIGSSTSLPLGPASGPDRATASAAGPSFASLLEQRGAGAPGVVPATRTKLTTDEARDALKSAWKTHFGEEPSEETTAILTAQWAHETGHGQSMWNFNFAGLKGKGPSGLSVSQRTKEGFGATERTITDQFRAYSSKEEGAVDYLGLLARRYPKALDAATQGNPESFVKELKSGGYFTGSEVAYTRSVRATTAQLLGREPTSDPSARAPATRLAAKPSAPRNFGVSPARAEETRPSANPSMSRSPLAERPHLSAFDGRSGGFGHGPAAPSLESFHDALSRAALRIALAPERDEEGYR